MWLPEDKRTDGGENLILMQALQFKIVMIIELSKVCLY